MLIIIITLRRFALQNATKAAQFRGVVNNLYNIYQEVILGFQNSFLLYVIIARAKLRQAAGKSDTINRVRFLYICMALGHFS